MALFSFNNLVDRFGEAIAWHYLSEIEKATYKKTMVASSIDPEIRLLNALRAQDAMTTHIHAKAA